MLSGVATQGSVMKSPLSDGHSKNDFDVNNCAGRVPVLQRSTND